MSNFNIKGLTANFEVDKNYLFIKEPLLGYTPKDVREFISDNNGNEALCYAFAAVFNEGAHLMLSLEWDNLTEEERIALTKRIEQWRELEVMLCDLLLSEEGVHTSGEELPIGYYHAAAPFMKKYGFSADYNIYLFDR